MRLITEAQEILIGRLATERQMDAETTILAEGRADLTARAAGQLIDRLLAAPRTTEDVPQAAEGYYVTDADQFVCVVATKDGQRTYAKVLNFHATESGAMRPSWDYAPRLGRTLAGLTPLSAEQVRHFGHLHGYCLKCLRPLTDAASVERGAGPTCWKRLTAIAEGRVPA